MTDDPGMLRRRRAGAFLRWTATAAVLALLLYFLPLAPLKAAIARVPPARFAIVLVVYLLAHSVGILKWRMVVNSAGARLDLRTAGQCYLGGLFGTLFLPSIVGGDVVRLAVGLRKSPRPAAVLAGNVADRFLDITAQAGLVILGMALLPGSLPPALGVSARRGLLLLVLAGVALLLLALLLGKSLLAGRSVRFRRRLGRLRLALRAVRRSPGTLFAGWLLGTGIQFLLLVLAALLAISCGLRLPLRVWLFAWPLAKLAAVLPLTQGGIGVREAALVALLAPFGAPGPLVLAAGLVWEGVIVCGGLAAGLAAYLLGRPETAGAAPSGPSAKHENQLI